MKKSWTKSLWLLLICMLFFNACRNNGQNFDDAKVMKNETMTVEKLLDYQNNALDRNNKFRKATSYMMKQKVTVQDSSKQFEVIQYFKVPNKSRILTYVNGKLTVTSLFNGKEGWRLDANSPDATPLVGKELEQQKVLAEMSNPAKSLIKIFKKIDLEEEKVDKTVYYKLTCHPYSKDLDPIVLYVDKEDYLTKRLEMNMWFNGKKIKYVSENQKYADIDGIKVVQVMVAYVFGIVQTYNLQDFKLDVPVNDADFELTGPYRVKQED